jgi:hypothetical protein
MVEHVAPPPDQPRDHADAPDQENQKYSGRDLDDHFQKPPQKNARAKLPGDVAVRLAGFENSLFLICCFYNATQPLT